MHSGTLITEHFTYTGTFQTNDFHGVGTIATSHGSIYQGQFARGQFHGVGTLRTLHEDTNVESVYTGDFVDGLFHGSGTITYSDGSSYAGTWYEGKRLEGTETLSNGDVFEGTFQNDVRKGQSKHRQITKQGIWEGDVLKEGEGLTITFANGHVYCGDHVHSRPHGEKMIVTLRWMQERLHSQNYSFANHIQKHHFQLNNLNYFVNSAHSVHTGFGKMEYADFGSGTVTYTGFFINGFRHGEGRCVFDKTGEEYEGDWLCDEPVDLKIFQHHGPLIEDEGDGDDLVDEMDCPISSLDTSTNFNIGNTDTTLNMSMTESCASLISAAETEDSMVNMSLDRISTSQTNMKNLRRRRCKSSVDFDDFSLSLKSLSVFEVSSDVPKLYRYQNGDTFTGRLDGANLRQGSGVFTEHRMGSVYDGDWKDSMRHGVGLLILSSGVEYSGEFFKDSIHGEGTLTLIDASVYAGGFVNGLFNGHGTFEDQGNNLTYIGEFQEGLRHGEGEEKHSDGSCYKGEYRYGKRHGIGVLYSHDGRELYRGGWCEDLWHGKGKLLGHRRKGTLWEGDYDGDFFQGKFCGNGTFTYTDGTSIEGQWLDDVPRDGDWSINYPDGSKFYGFATFRHPEESMSICDDSFSPGSEKCLSCAHLRVPLPHGFGTLTYLSGQRYIGSFVYGEYEDTRKNSTS